MDFKLDSILTHSQAKRHECCVFFSSSFSQTSYIQEQIFNVFSTNLDFIFKVDFKLFN